MFFTTIVFYYLCILLHLYLTTLLPLYFTTFAFYYIGILQFVFYIGFFKAVYLNSGRRCSLFIFILLLSSVKAISSSPSQSAYIKLLRLYLLYVLLCFHHVCVLDQGFSTFWYSRTPKSKLYPRCLPPNQKFYPNKHVLSGFKIWRTPPMSFSNTPRSTRSPG